MKTIDAARNHWGDILSKLGIDSSLLKNKHGPCPVCGGTDRFRWDNKNGSGSFICNQCGGGNGINLIMLYRGWEFKEAAQEIDKIIGNCQRDEFAKQPTKDPRDRLKKIQEKLKPIDGINPVSIYLDNRCLPKSKILKIHPSLAYYENGAYKGSHPAMVALFSSPTGEPITFHITYLTKHGTKAELEHCKKVMTPVSSMNGGAIRLFEPTGIMGIAEGIETALACFKLTGIPTWAAYSANLLEQFEPPEECKHLIIFGDNDMNFTGHKVSFSLANRLSLKGLDVEVRIPELPGTDWADSLLPEKIKQSLDGDKQ